MKLIAVLFSALLLAGLSIHNIAQAQPAGNLTSPNLVYMTTNPWTGPAGSNPGSWSNNFTTTTGSGGGLSGGNQPAYNATTGTFMFGYVQSTIAYNYAFSQALQTSGMTILGYNYSWDYINQDYTRGSLSANFTVNSTSNTSLYSKSWTLGTTTNGWTSFTGTETFTNPGLLASNIANFKLNFTGKDNRNWAGYYGPQFRNPSITLNYTFDSCAADPLSSPTCPGYAAAYLTQQCTANALYDPSCPGYAAALFTQQCSANPLSNPQCPGYAAAYLTQQCTIDPLYSTTCAGYDQAYFNQQCSLNGLYSKNCPNYATAYANKMLKEQQTAATSTVVTTTAVSSDGSVSATPSATGDTTIDKVITPTTSTANSTASPAAAVQLVPAPATSTTVSAVTAETKSESKKEDSKETAANTSSNNSGSSSEIGRAHV